jgi:hypothetical protein
MALAPPRARLEMAMNDSDKTQYAQQSLNQNADLGAGLIDVLIRGLETAKRNLEDGDGPEVREFCALAYGTPGTFCPLAYWHRPEQ